MTTRLPDGWTPAQLGDIASVVTGFAFKSTSFADAGLPIIRMSNLNKGRLRLQDAARVPANVVDGMDQYRLEEGDLLLGLSGSIENFAVVSRTDLPCYLNQRVGKFVLRDASALNYGYLRFHVQAKQFREQVLGLAVGAAQLNVSPKQLERLGLLLPPLPEQRKIAGILSSVDDAIERTQTVIDQVQVVKRGLMQELLTRGLPGRHSRFKQTEIGEIPEEWESVQLGSLCRDVADGPHFSPKYVEREKGVPILSARNVRVDGWSLGDVKYVSREDHAEFCKRARPKPGDVLYTKGGSVGIARVNDLPFEFSVWVHVALLKLRRERVNPWFLAAMLNSKPCYKQVLLFTHGTSNRDLGLTRMVKIRFPLPPLAEQTEIAERLRAADDRMTRESDTAEQLRVLKSALMSVLLTGELCVTPDTEAA